MCFARLQVLSESKTNYAAIGKLVVTITQALLHMLIIAKLLNIQFNLLQNI